MSPPCSTEGCDASARIKGLCRNCYQRAWARQKALKQGRVIRDRPSRMEQFQRSFSVDTNGCWTWFGSNNGRGYGLFWDNGKVYAHRWSYEHHVGPIPDGLVIDHLCRNPACVNPDHLEPVSQAVNFRRGEANAAKKAKTHCPNGHPYEGRNVLLNTRGCRGCRTCANEYRRRMRRERRAAA